MTTFGTTRNTRLRTALALAIAGVLTGCTFGDNFVPTAQTGVAAAFSDCVPKECYYGCCSGTDFDWVPQLVGGETSKPACKKFMKNDAYAQYSALTALDINYCLGDFTYEWGNCVAIPPEDVVGLTPDGGTAPSGLHFNECPPSGDWVAYPIDEIEIEP